MSGRPKNRLRISVVVPAWNDQENLAALLPMLANLDLHEIIVVDASNDGKSSAFAQIAGANLIHFSGPNRGGQMNRGAESATGDVLIFHHADAQLTDAHLQAIRHAMDDPRVVGGAFYRKFDRRHSRLLWLEKIARFLTRHGGTFYGDQSVFIRREHFVALGGYAKIPLMEDMEFSKRLRASGRVIVLDPPVQSSGRRHVHRGAWRTSVQNAFCVILYKCGASPHRLHRWYYRDHQHANGEVTRELDPSTFSS